jgi:hypothetical protein
MKYLLLIYSNPENWLATRLTTSLSEQHYLRGRAARLAQERR